MNNDELIGKTYQTNLMIYFAILSSIGGYIVISFVLAKVGSVPPFINFIPKLQLIFLFLSLPLFGLSLNIKKIMLASLEKRQTKIEFTEILKIYNAGNIISFALVEAISIMGLVIVVLSKNVKLGIPFFIIGVICMLFSFPKKTELEDITNRFLNL